MKCFERLTVSEKFLGWFVCEDSLVVILGSASSVVHVHVGDRLLVETI